jgi:hypothetical protein
VRSVGRWLFKQFQKLALLPEYFRAIAKEWLNILFGETLLAVLFLLWWSLANPSNPRLILVFVAAMFVAGYYAWRADHVRLIPKFEIREFRIQPTPTTDATGRISGSSIWIQLVPKCLTEAEVANCQGHLQRVCKWSNAEGWLETELNETLPLGWSLLDEGHSPIILHPGVERRLNVFSIHSNNGVIVPCVYPMPLRAQPVFSRITTSGEPNAFRFDIKVTAKDCPDIDLQMKVQTRNDPFDPDIELLPVKNKR